MLQRVGLLQACAKIIEEHEFAFLHSQAQELVLGKGEGQHSQVDRGEGMDSRQAGAWIVDGGMDGRQAGAWTAGKVGGVDSG